MWKFSFADQANNRPVIQQSMIKDHTTRKIARKINKSDISELRFYGIDMNCFANHPVIVKKRQTIYTFIYFLQNAYTSEHQSGLNRVDTLDIHLKKSKVHPHIHDPIILNFNLKNSEDCFGPEFQKAAQALSKTRKPLN